MILQKVPFDDKKILGLHFSMQSNVKKSEVVWRDCLVYNIWKNTLF